MEYASFDSGAPVAFPSPAVVSYTASNSVNTDTKKNVRKKLVKQVKDSYDYCRIRS